MNAVRRRDRSSIWQILIELVWCTAYTQGVVVVSPVWGVDLCSCSTSSDSPFGLGLAFSLALLTHHPGLCPLVGHRSDTKVLALIIHHGVEPAHHPLQLHHFNRGPHFGILVLADRVQVESDCVPRNKNGSCGIIAIFSRRPVHANLRDIDPVNADSSKMRRVARRRRLQSE